MRKRVFLQGGILLHISFPYLVHTSRSSLSSHHVTRTNEIILLSCIFFRDFFSSLKFTELAALWNSLNKKCAKSKGMIISQALFSKLRIMPIYFAHYGF